MAEKLTESQKKFADEYIKTGNATQAYMLAYPRVKSDATAAACGARLIRNDKVKKYIGQRNQEVSNKRIADIQEVKEYWTTVMRNNEEKTPDRIKVSELLAKTCGAFLEQPEKDNGLILKLIHELRDNNG